MRKKWADIFPGFIALLLTILISNSFSQISPGDLSEVHSHLEGMSNCTQCHLLGDKVSNEKCLTCHTEIKARLDENKGYHASSEVKTKDCVVCHNDHHGKTFEIIRFEKEIFDHKLSGYVLEGAHARKECSACHKREFISDQKIKSKKYDTFLGLKTTCLSCHSDYHRNTLSQNCTDCHGFEAFKPANAFDHNRTKFSLTGKHQQVDCIKCHKIETADGQKFQQFQGILFSNCTSCHIDVHKNKFGQDCRQCHNEESFHQIIGLQNFDHNKTNFKLKNKHTAVFCKLCHKTALTDPVKHERCVDCHADYHQNQFARQGISPDCSSCHSTYGFAGSSYTIAKHNESEFPLEGAHLATPCFACHLKTEKWSFREIGIKCNDCHPDIHTTFIDPKYYPASDCRNCHSAGRWNEIKFDHAKTEFSLSGAHLKQSCRSCHFFTNDTGKVSQRFSGLTSKCTECHKDIHSRQFDNEGITDCNRCHTSDNWKASKFDHDSTLFVLDGRHKDVECVKCHKPTQVEDITFIQYKLNEFKCETCHR